MDAAHVLFRSIEPRLAGRVTYNAFREQLADWTFIPLYEGGEMIGAAMRRGNELHVGFVRQGNCVRRHIRDVLIGMLDECGEVVTSVCADNARGLRFCERLGFERVSERDGVIKMKCTVQL